MTNYTEEVKKILKTSEVEMLNLHHPFLGTEHLLLGILKTNNDIKELLNKKNIYYENFKAKLIKYVKKGNKRSNNITYTPLLKRIILNASKDGKTDLKNLMISFLEEGEGIGITLLNNMKLDLNNFYQTIKNIAKTQEYGINLNELAKNNKLTPVINRENEINELIEVLSRKNKCNPLLIGKAGTGKTAIVEGLAIKIVNKEVPKFMQNKEIISINLSSVISGTRYRGEFEEKLHKIIKDFENNPNLIMFIDEVHTLVGAGGAEGAIDASNILKPYLARNNIKCIGATTLAEYKKSILKDKALNRRFQKIEIEEPNIEKTKYILKSIKNIYENYHNVIITNNQIDSLVDLTSKYILDKSEPDRSIDILDEVCTKTSIYDYEKETKKLKMELEKIKEKKEEAIYNKDISLATHYKEKEKNIEKKVNRYKPKVKNETIKNVILNKTKRNIKPIGYTAEISYT